MKEVSNEKIGNLRDIILDRADDEKKNQLDKGRREAETWLDHETEKLHRETNLILQDARKRAEDIRRRQILAAEREKATETLRLQNRLLSDAMGRLQDQLVHLRDSDQYADILAGMCLDAADSLGMSVPLKVRLSAVDMSLAVRVINNVCAAKPGLRISFDPEPAPILGGCWIVTADGHRQVNMDWQNITQEMADSLAERLLPLL